MNATDQIDTDNELFLRVRDHNDVAAFRELYRRYHKRIFAYCVRIVGQEEGARDAFQNVFTAVYEQRQQFEPGEFSRWLFSIAKRQAQRVYTRTVADRVPAEVEELAIESMIDEDAVDSEDLQMASYVRRAVNELPSEFRDVIMLRYFEDLSYEDIATQLNISLSLAKVRVNRAKARLQSLLNLTPEDLS